jgi:hypothetical protein
MSAPGAQSRRITTTEEGAGLNVKDGYILPFDAATTIREAQASRIGR